MMPLALAWANALRLRVLARLLCRAWKMDFRYVASANGRSPSADAAPQEQPASALRLGL
ncbi:MAG TPA: hypothetical protein VIN09_04410 [Chloroflexota bacterium]|jgi:hypothetical protein